MSDSADLNPNELLAAYIKRRRENLRMSRQQLAIQINSYPYPSNKAGVNIDSWLVRRIEEQARVIEPWMLPAIAYGLGVTVKDLIYPSKAIQ